VTFHLTTRAGHPTFVDLPWDLPLERWELDRIVSPVRGISRHVVRFVAYGSAMYAVKEIVDELAEREYRLLRELAGEGLPVVEAIGLAVGRTDAAGEALDGILVTKHLDFSLPYRALFSHRPTEGEPWSTLLDALAELLVRLHLAGFFWGDCSLSNTLFRRDAGALSAWMVDAETGELKPSLSDGMRQHDLELAEVNVVGELYDLVAAGRLDESIDAVAIGEDLVARYTSLWAELTREEEIGPDEDHRVHARVARLNELGFDVEEVELLSTGTAHRLRLRTCVLESAHHRRRLLELVGLDAQENQARRMLNDIRRYGAQMRERNGYALAEPVLALRWLVDVFEPTIARIPERLRGKLPAAEIYHQLMEHRWFMSEQAGSDVGIERAIADYVERVLTALPDERQLLALTDDGANS
jgi:hypothetical protein